MYVSQEIRVVRMMPNNKHCLELELGCIVGGMPGCGVEPATEKVLECLPRTGSLHRSQPNCFCFSRRNDVEEAHFGKTKCFWLMDILS